MANDEVPTPKGTDVLGRPLQPDPFPASAGGALPTPGGIELKAGDRIIKDVKKDWDASNPKTTPDIVVHGKNSKEVGNALMALPGEWGQGGGRLLNDAVAAGTSPEVTVTLHANLVRRMANWPEYAQASKEAQASWDKMFAKLGVHEDKHVSNAVAAAEQCAKDLIGKEILEMPGIVTKANADLKAVQDALDTATEHGAKAGVPFGDVIFDVVD